MANHRRPTPPEVVLGALRSVSPPELEAQSVPGAGPPAWFVAIQNLAKKLDDHEERDVTRHEEQGSRISRLERKVGWFGLIGGALGSAGPQLFEWIFK